MKIYYDSETDSLYMEMGDGQPDRVVELADGINLDTTPDGQLIGLEILEASSKIDLSTIMSYTLDLGNTQINLSDNRTATA